MIRILTSCCILTTVLVASSDENTKECNENNLHQCLTKEELENIFGSSTKIPHYELSQVQIQHTRKRSTGEDEMEASIKLKEKQIQLQLKGHSQLISPAFKVVKRYGDHNFTTLSSQVECVYTGNVLDRPGSVVAVSKCSENDDLSGYVFLNGADYIVQPLPPRVKGLLALQGQGAKTDLEIVYQADRTGDTCVSHNKEWKEESYVEVIPLYPETKETNSNMKRKRRDVQQPQQRTGDEENTIELALFVDNTMYKRFYNLHGEDADRQIINMVLTMINGMSALYNSKSLGNNISFVVVRLEIFAEDTVGPDSADGEIVNYLKNFCVWQSTRNTLIGSDPEHWDHAILMSGINLYDYLPKWKSVVGLAWIGGMCDVSRSCSVSEGRNFEAAYIMTHELGHNLGMVHDGTDNVCKGSKDIMAMSMGPGFIHWSNCSSEELQIFLKKNQAKCLLDRSSNRLAFSRSIVQGVQYSADQQCTHKFGDNSRAHIVEDDDRFNNICRALFCENTTHILFGHAALEGTECNGTQWVCKSGSCQYDETIPIQLISSTTEATTKEPNVTEEIDHGEIGGIVRRYTDWMYEVYDEAMEAIQNITDPRLFGVDVSSEGMFQTFADVIFPFLGLLEPDIFLASRIEERDDNITDT